MAENNVSFSTDVRKHETDKRLLRNCLLGQNCYEMNIFFQSQKVIVSSILYTRDHN